MKKEARIRIFFALLVSWFMTGGGIVMGATHSGATAECLDCHAAMTPGLVESWKKSRHAVTSPQEALQKGSLERRISNEKIPADFAKNAVGCAECHTVNADKHKDTFEHNGYNVHVVVTPSDCATCHPVEVNQYQDNIMSQAYGNLVNNPVFTDLARTINGVHQWDKTELTIKEPDAETQADSCLFCHGTAIEVKGSVSRNTDYGTLDFPVLSGWPNQGVGRINPDGSKGSCAACHTRHQFSIEMARTPSTCATCHKGPDVPAYKVYNVSKHGNIYDAHKKEWDLQAVPWKVGKDFTAPTCATCHVSLITDGEGNPVAERTHRMNDRLPWRIFGLVYAHAHPKSPDTSVIKNKAGLPLPTELTGEPAADYLIDSPEQDKRRQAMHRVCFSCHSREWVDNHWTRFENTIRTTNASTLTGTQIMQTIWEKNLARGISQKDSLFNEGIERKWSDLWLFYANTVRFSSAMSGGDYGVFENGRYFMTGQIQEMKDWLDLRMNLPK